MFDVLFYLLFILFISGHYRLDVSMFERIKDYEEKTSSSSQRKSKASDQLPYWTYVLSFSSIHKPHVLIGYLSLHTLGLSFYS
jgi:hypothetical protein